jgi:triacylglycerol lipase
LNRRHMIIGAAALSAGFLAIPHGAALAAGTPKIDFKLLYQAALLADQSYKGGSEIIGKYPGKKAWVATPGDTNVQYVLIQNDERKIQAIAVRGTVDDTNWDLDMDTRGVKDQKAGILMHHGFRKAAEVIYRDLQPRLKPDYQTYLTGHSLGGAVAAILGTYLVDDKFKVAAIITFGQPKFTNVAGALAYRDLPLLRVINQNDAVATLPDETKDGGQQFAHVGAVINLLSGPYYVYADADQSREFSVGTLGRFVTQISVPDHYMRWYLKNLQGKQNGAIAVSFADRDKYIVRLKPGKAASSFDKPKKQYNFGSQQ